MALTQGLGQGSIYIFSLLCSITLLFATIGALLPVGSQDQVLSYIGIKSNNPSLPFDILLVISALIYIIELSVSEITKYLWNIDNIQVVLTLHIKAIRAKQPIIQFWCECYHFENRIRFVSKQVYSNGRYYNVTEPQVYQEKVVTFKGTSEFVYWRFDDISEPATSDMFDHDAIMIDFLQNICLADGQTRLAYELQKQNFINMNRGRDLFLFGEISQLNGFKSRFLLWFVRVKQPK
jgi:hypothetical protein